MGSLDGAYEIIDWSHSPASNENYWHYGSLYSYVLNPALTIGLSDYINLTISRTIGSRIMNYEEVEGVNPTPHHRDEGTHTDFLDQANGGLLGDTRLLLRYLILNDGMRGNRLFIGTGLTIPSQSRLTKSPFIQNDDGSYDEHRHFAMSEGNYQWLGELQFYRKLSPPIIFWGISSSVSYPIQKNSDGFLAPIKYDISFSLLTQKMRIINAALGIYLQYKYAGISTWDGIENKNSEGQIFTPGFGFIWTTKNKLGIAVNCLFPQLLNNSTLAAIETNVDSNINAWQMTLGIRKTFDYSIPFLE